MEKCVFLLRKLLALSLSILISTILHWFNTIRRFRCFLYDVVLININKNNPYLQKRGNTCYDLSTHSDENINMFCQSCTCM